MNNITPKAKRKTVTISIPENKHTEMKFLAKTNGYTLSELILKKFYAKDKT